MIDPQETSILLGGPINALSLSPDRTAVAVAGRDVFNIVSLKNSRFEVTHSLRPVRKSLNLTYSSVDVKWHPMEQNKYMLATAATNGAVVIWNIRPDGTHKQEKPITDHTRTVNRVCWHPEHAFTLLSGSQDGTMKLWDIRDVQNCKVTFDGKSEPVRDVHFSPFYSNYFAAGFENGCIQIWDIRKHTSFERKISSAHQGPISCVRWHPEEKSQLATGGRDRMIQVWDLNNEKNERNQTRPVHALETILGVARIEWRPEHRQHVISCGTMDTKVHLWSFKKKFIPVASFNGQSDWVTDVQFLTPTQILTVGKDSYLRLQTLTNATRPYQHISTTAISWTPKNSLGIISEQINRNDLGEETLAPQVQFPSFFSANLTTIPTPPPPTIKQQFNPKSIHLVNLEPPTSGSAFGFDSRIFCYLANHYQYQKQPFDVLCETNSKVAEKVGQYQISQTWKLLKLFFENETVTPAPGNPAPAPPKKPVHKSSSSESVVSPRMFSRRHPTIESILDSSIQSEDSLEEDNNFSSADPTISYESLDDFISADISIPLTSLPNSSTIPPPNQTLSSKSRKKNNSFQELAINFEEELSWNPRQQVVETLEYYAEQGDVQSAVIMARVLGDRVHIDKTKLKHWTNSYLELLKRLQLYVHSNDLVKYNTDKQMSVVPSTIHAGCPSCSKGMETLPYWRCQRCKKTTNACSICNQKVKGLYVWCQVCGHGGHLDHLSDWFQKEKSCPTGCGHNCKMIKAPKVKKLTSNT